MTSTPTSDSDEIQKIGKYKVLGALGRGSMGVVYRGQDPEIGRIVAIKVLRNKSFQGAEAQVALERFKTEARSAGNLRHPHIITVFDVNIDGENPYIVMDFLEGQTIAQIINSKGKCSVKQALHYLWQIASGLDHAHSKRIIHRDIKPSNILIDKSDNAFILDFGVASFGEGTINDQSFLGTPNYMSPEQLQRKQIDYRADLFGFAVMAFEMFTGRKPFFGENLASLVNQIVNGSPIMLSDVSPGLPLTLQAEFEKALSKNPEDRFQNADSMVAAFSAALGQNAPESGVYVQSTGVSRKRKFSEWKVVNTVQNTVQRITQSNDKHSRENERQRKGTPLEASPWRPENRNVAAHDFVLTKGASYSNRPGTLYSESDTVLNTGSIFISKYKNFTIVFCVLSILLSGFIIYMSLTSEDSAVEKSTSNYPIESIDARDHINQQPVQKPKTVSFDPNKVVYELSDQQLVSVLVSAESTESYIIQAIREAKQRKLSGFTEAAPALLKRDSYVIRIETLKLLIEIGDSRVVPNVIITLDDHDPLVRRWAARALAKIGDRKVVGYLEARLIKDDVEDVRVDIKKAIEKITGVPYAN